MTIDKLKQAKFQMTGTLLILGILGLLLRIPSLGSGQDGHDSQIPVLGARDSEERSAPAEVTFQIESAGESSSDNDSKGSIPRVSVYDQAAFPHGEMVSLDSFPDESLEEDAQGRIMNGQRQRLLMEAIERALHSETPWIDLAQVALGYSRAGDAETTAYWLKRASTMAMDPDNLLQSNQRLHSVIKAMCAAREFQMAEDYIARLTIDREKQAAKVDLVQAFAKAKRFEEARRVTAEVSNQKVQAQALQSIAIGEARYLGVAEALQTLGLISESRLQDQVFSKVAAVFVNVGEVDAAMSLIKRIESSRARNLALAQVAKEQARGSKNFDSVISLINDPFFRDEALRGLVEIEADRRKINLAEASINRIKSPAEQSKAQEALVQLQVRYGELSGALQRAQTIPVKNARYRAIQTVAVAEVTESGSRVARGTANLIPSEKVRDATMRKIAQRAATAGQSREAIETIYYMSDPGERAMALANVALTSARYGDDRGAFQLAQDANQELAYVESSSQEARTTGVLAEVFAETGDADSALSYAASIQNGKMRDQTYQRLALRFAKSRETDLAEKSAHFIKGEKAREKTLASVAKTLAGQVPVSEGLNVVDVLDARRQQVQFLVALAARG